MSAEAQKMFAEKKFQIRVTGLEKIKELLGFIPEEVKNKTSPAVEVRFEYYCVAKEATRVIKSVWADECPNESYFRGIHLEDKTKNKILQKFPKETFETTENLVQLPIPSWVHEGQCDCAHGGGIYANIATDSEAKKLVEEFKKLLDESLE